MICSVSNLSHSYNIHYGGTLFILLKIPVLITHTYLHNTTLIYNEYIMFLVPVQHRY